MAQPQQLGSDKFAALHSAFVGEGAFIYIPRGVEVHAPIVVVHDPEQEFCLQLRGIHKAADDLI